MKKRKLNCPKTDLLIAFAKKRGIKLIKMKTATPPPGGWKMWYKGGPL